MSKLLNYLVLGWLLLAVAELQALAQTTKLYVAPGGDDGGPGTEEKPLATLAHARDMVGEKLGAGLRGDVEVVVRNGFYELAKPLVIGQKFSGTEKFSISFTAYPGETPIISGGRKINGWQKGTGELWTVTLPEVASGKWYFRQLFVDGHRAVRARTPNLDGYSPYFLMTGVDLDERTQRFRLRLTKGQVEPWKAPADVEFVMLGEWEMIRKRVAHIDSLNSAVDLMPPHVFGSPSNFPREGRRCYFEGAIEMLHRPGEWALDRHTGTLSYWPLKGQDMAQVEMVAPRLSSLLEISGTAAHPVRNVHFKGFRFAHTEWPLPDEGYWGIQACFYWTRNFSRPWYDLAAPMGAALTWQFAHDCSLEDSEITHIGGAALSLLRGCSSNLIQGNGIDDVGGNGVMIGEGKNISNRSDIVANNRVLNNLIHHCGADYFGAVGIWVGLAQNTYIAHNEVHDLPYSGISIGWRWDDGPTACQGNVVEYNDVHHFMGTLSDGGGIYTLGFQPGTILRGNLVRDSAFHGQGTYGSFALDFDNGSKGMQIEDNITSLAGGIRINGNPDSVTPKNWYTWGTNYFDVYRTDTNFPSAAAARAGLEPEYRKRFREDGAAQKTK